MQNVVQVLEKQYLEEKRMALEEQRLMYERELESLRQQLSPEKTSQHHRSSSERLTFPTHTPHSKLRLWTEERLVECTHKSQVFCMRTSPTHHESQSACLTQLNVLSINLNQPNHELCTCAEH